MNQFRISSSVNISPALFLFLDVVAEVTYVSVLHDYDETTVFDVATNVLNNVGVIQVP